MDNAKIFSQLISKSRSLTKVSERRLQLVAYARGGGGGGGAAKPSFIHVTSLCCSDTARKIIPSCGKISTRHKRMQGRGDGTMQPLWPCNKVLKPNFQSIISN